MQIRLNHNNDVLLISSITLTKYRDANLTQDCFTSFPKCDEAQMIGYLKFYSDR